jgi:aspartate/methionine/tyrosine aminotransferase
MSGDASAFAGGRLDLLDVQYAPGQQSHGEAAADLVDFSHGDVDAFPPYPGAFEAVARAFAQGTAMAYSEYRGHRSVREPLAGRLAALTGAPVDPDRELIITPGTETGLFLALSCLVAPGDRVAIVEPDYFANRKIVQYLRGEILPVRLDYLRDDPAELDLEQLREAVRRGARVVCLSNPNNPTGVVYSNGQLRDILSIAQEGGAFVVADQLYSRLIYPGIAYPSLRSIDGAADNCVTLVGPSKTESLSGFRVGAALGPAWLIDRMEKLLSIVSLRTAAYNQAALHAWLIEPAEWLEERVDAHRRDPGRPPRTPAVSGGDGGAHDVADAASETIVRRLGDQALGVRTAVGVHSLPGGAPAEVELTVVTRTGSGH